MAKIKATQLDFFAPSKAEDSLSDQELMSFNAKAKNKSADVGGAISRLVKAKRYHEVANQLSNEVLKLRLENEKLREQIKMFKQAN